MHGHGAPQFMNEGIVQCSHMRWSQHGCLSGYSAWSHKLTVFSMLSSASLLYSLGCWQFLISPGMRRNSPRLFHDSFQGAGPMAMLLWHIMKRTARGRAGPTAMLLWHIMKRNRGMTTPNDTFSFLQVLSEWERCIQTEAPAPTNRRDAAAAARGARHQQPSRGKYQHGGVNEPRGGYQPRGAYGPPGSEVLTGP
jgi:hypothetical protein